MHGYVYRYKLEWYFSNKSGYVQIAESSILLNVGKIAKFSLFTSFSNEVSAV